MKTQNPASYYIYRSLHTNTWIVKHKGKFIDHPANIVAYGCSFVVHDAGRLKVIEEGRKNVHAYVVCDHYTVRDTKMFIDVYFEEVTYNPYEDVLFKRKVSGSIIQKAEWLCMQDCRVYINKQ